MKTRIFYSANIKRTFGHESEMLLSALYSHSFISIPLLLRFTNQTFSKALSIVLMCLFSAALNLDESKVHIS